MESKDPHYKQPVVNDNNILHWEITLLPVIFYLLFPKFSCHFYRSSWYIDYRWRCKYLFCRIRNRTAKVASRSLSTSQQITHSDPRLLLSWRRSTTPTLTRKEKSASVSLPLITGSLPPRSSKVCLNSLNYLWLISKFSVLQSLVSLIIEPDLENPLRADLAEEYQKENKKFVKNAEEYTKRYAEKL